VPLAYKNRPYLGRCGNSEEIIILILLSLFVAVYPCIPTIKVCIKEKRVFSETVCLQRFLRISNN